MIKETPLITDLVEGKTDKTDEKIEFFGQVDELSAFIMEFAHCAKDKKLEMELRKVVRILSVASGEIAGGYGHVGEAHLSELVELVNEYEEKAGPFQGFVLQGETLLGAKAHIVRTVCRRAERAYARVFEKYNTSKLVFEYLNKLSTLFYAVARIYDEN